MIRNVSICIVGILLNFILIGVFGWALAHYTDFGKWTEANVRKGKVLTEQETVEQIGKTRKEILDSLDRYNYLVAFPIISVLIGVFIGLLVTKYLLPITTLSNIATLLFFDSEIWIGLTYLIISCVTGWFIFKFVRKVKIA